jgi:hypothetical protein
LLPDYSQERDVIIELQTLLFKSNHLVTTHITGSASVVLYVSPWIAVVSFVTHLVHTGLREPENPFEDPSFLWDTKPFCEPFYRIILKSEMRL